MRAKLVLAVIFLWSASAASAGDFRGASWGMTKEEVKAAEKSSPPAVDNEVKPGSDRVLGLRYQGAIGEIPALISYYFTDGKLIRGEYEVKIGLLEDDKDYYQKLRKSLGEKYGTPASDGKEMSKDPIFKRLLGWKTVWRTPTTEIVMFKKEPEGSVTITYADLSYQEPGRPQPRTVSQDL